MNGYFRSMNTGETHTRNTQNTKHKTRIRCVCYKVHKKRASLFIFFLLLALYHLSTIISTHSLNVFTVFSFTLFILFRERELHVFCPYCSIEFVWVWFIVVVVAVADVVVAVAVTACFSYWIRCRLLFIVDFSIFHRLCRVVLCARWMVNGVMVVGDKAFQQLLLCSVCKMLCVNSTTNWWKCLKSLFF